MQENFKLEHILYNYNKVYYFLEFSVGEPVPGAGPF